MTSPTSLIFFGNEKLATGLPEAEPIIRRSLESAGYTIEAAVITREIPAHDSKLAVLAAYGKILPQAVLDQFPLGIINVHPSLLPIYRGPTPIEWAILDGATTTGVSIMRLTSQMDAGPIYAQRSIELSGGETKLELAERLQRLGSELILKVLPEILDSSSKPQEQDAALQPSYSKLIKKSDGLIDWSKPAAHLEREVRAYIGWPGSYTKLGGVDVTITRARIEANEAQPGHAVAAPSGEIMVGCGQGSLVIEYLKPAGKREMSAAEFLAGHRL